MKIRTIIIAILFASVCYTTGAIESGDFGIVTEFNSEADLFIGVVWHPLTWLQIRPIILVLGRNTETEYEDFTERDIFDDLRFGGGIDLLFTFEMRENLYLYVGPRVEYIYLKQNRRNELDPSASNFNFERINHSIEFGAVVGGEYMFSNGFGFFGDILVGGEYNINTRVFSRYC